jgi:hypothetical protein
MADPMGMWNMGTGGGTTFGSGTNWGPIQGMTGDMGSIFGPTDVLSTFDKSPAALWQAARIRQMGQNAAIPQFQRTAMRGFTPALGRYMLGGDTGQTFAQYINPQGVTGGANFASANPTYGDWTSAVLASRGLDPSYRSGTFNPTERQIATQTLLTNENARRNALAMAGAAMGGGVGMLAEARQQGLGNLYDLYAARAAGAGAPAGGFLGYLGGMMNPTTFSGMTGYTSPTAPVIDEPTIPPIPPDVLPGYIPLPEGLP